MNKTLTTIFKIIWLLAFITGGIALIMKFATGERLAGYGSYVPWGLWVALYFHFVGIAGGAFAIGAVGYVLNINGFRNSLRVFTFVSIVSVLLALFSIWLDLGQPFRLTRILYAPNFNSMLAFNAWMYIIFIGAAVLIFILSFRKSNQNDLNDKSRWLFPLLCLATVFAIAFPSQSGAFFGVVDAKPFWNSPLLPILFLISAITAGSAVLYLVFIYVFREKYSVKESPFRFLKYTIITGIILYFAAEFAEYSIIFWSPNSHILEAAKLILFGPFWWVFWIIHVGGSVIALILFYKGKSFVTMGIGACIVAVTFISARLNILIPGQAIEELKGLQAAFFHERLQYQYTATINEYLVAVFIVASGILLVYAGIAIIKKLAFKKTGEEF
jgi:protein NrfD